MKVPIYCLLLMGVVGCGRTTPQQDLTALKAMGARVPKTVEEFTNLRTLDLTSTQVTDAGLAHLKGLTNLRALILYNTQVTDAGIAKLKKALPRLNVPRQ